MLDWTDLRVYVNHIKTIIHKTKVALALSIALLCPTFVPASLSIPNPQYKIYLNGRLPQP